MSSRETFLHVPHAAVRGVCRACVRVLARYVVGTGCESTVARTPCREMVWGERAPGPRGVPGLFARLLAGPFFVLRGQLGW